VSDVVVAEIRLAPSAEQDQILAHLQKIDPIVLDVPNEADALAQRFIDEGVLPARRMDDARHVACAMAHDLDLLVSWNYRHIANVTKAEAFNAVAVLSGWPGNLAIHTRLEVLEWE